MRAQVHYRALTFLITGMCTALLMFSGVASAQGLTKDQAKCLNGANKNAAKIVKAQGKDICDCIKDGVKGKLTAPGAIEDCLTSDPKGKVAKAKAKYDSKTGNCDAGFVNLASAAVVKQASMDKDLSLIHWVFGNDLDLAIILDSRCQSKVAKALKKCEDEKLKAYNGCKKDAIKGKNGPAVTSAQELQDRCLGTGTGTIPDPKGKLAKCNQKMLDTIDQNCPDLGVFPGCPGVTTGAELKLCIDYMIECEVCLFLNAIDGLNRNCDEFDDGVLNASCGVCGDGVVNQESELCDDGNGDNVDSCRNDCTVGPTDFASVSIPSPAKPANTPDGTAANAVPPGSTLDIQFGSSIFDLNNATYTRFFAPGAGDPDAVLILVPGVGGDARSFKYLAENLIVRAQIDGTIVLEVWGIDRRTNQLEDDAGVLLAAADRDALLALDWYFGAELGLMLDPRLTRRAVFHAGEDVAFIANFTAHMFARDTNAVIDAALALPSSPVVFLGGHSLGTTLTVRYAATDFEPGPGVDAGYSKLAGLALFEGGGDSVAAAVPSDDSLDLIIAKADGGLYQAVKNGDARCVDGTPCPGGNADCAAVALPPGALTNKCVVAVDAYTGADTTSIVLPKPQSHAAVQVVSIQGTFDPDSLSLIQQDFGLGPATAVVPGLLAVAGLPPSNPGAVLGFFLDDDFATPGFGSSFGYSNNGLNSPFIGPAFPPDPFRIWLDIDQVMPPEAIPNNGSPTSFLSRWGQEKEVTRLDVILTKGQKGADFYFASSGLSVTPTLFALFFGGGLDSTPLSVGRGRPDIENLTQAAAIDIPVIAFGGTNGLSPTRARFEGFAASIAICTASSCTGSTPRVVASDPINTVYGDVAGGYEVYLNEGYAHDDVLNAEDDPSHNNVYDPLMAFLLRNTP